MSAPLSEHTVHVPPRQTCHVRAGHPDEAASIVLTECAWGASHEETPAPPPRDALHLAVFLRPDLGGHRYSLADRKTSITFEADKIVAVEIGNSSDTPLEVAFEIWGKP